MTAPLLLIEDTPSLRLVYEAVLQNADHTVISCGTAAEGFAAFEKHDPQVVLLDLMLPDRDGIDLMRDILQQASNTRVIVITANGSINLAVEAMRAGAYEFLLKPFNEQRFLDVIANAQNECHGTAVQPDNPAARETLGFIGTSGIMNKVYSDIRTVAPSMATVFITGESGTGKEICAEAVHGMSDRAGGPFVPINCAAIPGDLLESEVFGHLRGSFTGAISDKPGAAAAADGGTLFLDEICEMDMNLQTKLLRFLQTSKINPVGSVTARKVNVRIVCATNRNPLEAVRLGKFREDLFYRLHVVPIHLPPLRDRGEDVIELAEDALRRFSAEEGRLFKRLSPQVKSLFRTLPWPGNVRQLMNVMRNIVVLNDGDEVTEQMLPVDLMNRGDPQPDTTPAHVSASAPTSATVAAQTLDGLIGKTLPEIERIVIEETIARNGGSVTKAAAMLDVSPSTLYRKRAAWNES